jgi:hypothetical protein
MEFPLNRNDYKPENSITAQHVILQNTVSLELMFDALILFGKFLLQHNHMNI